MIVNYDPNHPGASLRSIAHSDLSQTNGISCEGIIRRKAGGTGFFFQIKASGQNIQYDVIVYGSSRNLSMPTLHQADTSVDQKTNKTNHQPMNPLDKALRERIIACGMMSK